jgi:hypothetical protein
MAPKLGDLTFVEERGENYRDLTPTLQNFYLDGIPFGSPLLRQLTIEELDLTPEIIPYMRQLTSLEILKLISCRVWNASFAPLWTEPTTLFLPSLSLFVMQHSIAVDNDVYFAELGQKCAAARPSLKLFIL